MSQDFTYKLYNNALIYKNQFINKNLMDIDHNPYQVFQQDSQENLPYQNNLPVEEPTKPEARIESMLKIKKRRIMHKENFYGRGANHPSFFLRKFFAKLQISSLSSLYGDDSKILHKLVEKVNRYKTSKNRFNLQDLKQFFGEKSAEQDKRSNYLNRKLLFQLISEKSVELILEGSKCNQVLNHLISIQKYSGRLCHPKLVGRVQFQ